MNFFPDQADNDAFEDYKIAVINDCVHGVPPSDATLIKAFVEGRTVEQVAAEADWDYEEADYDDSVEQFPLYPWEG